MSNSHSFSDGAIQSAVESAQSHYQSVQANYVDHNSLTVSNDNGHLSILAECIKVTISDRKICLNLPFNINGARGRT